jgi:hypothetical protein
MNHADCLRTLIENWKAACAEVGDGQPIEVTISTAPPLVPNPWTHRATCPHGVTFWMEPTGEQLASWAAKPPGFRGD